MTRFLKWKVLLILAIIGVCAWKAYPPFDVFDKSGKLVEEGRLNLGLDLQGGMHVVLRVDTSKLPQNAHEGATERALEIIRNRIDQFGVLEPSIQREGKDRITVQLPGITDRDRALELIGKTAHLEFKLVSDDVDLLKKALDGEAIEDYELKYLGNDPLLIQKDASLTGDTLIDATVEFSQRTFGEPYVSLTFDGKGAQIFSDVTGKNVGRRLAIVLDGKPQSAPVIRERIPSGRAQITGQFSVDDANDLAIVLRAGALPAPIEILEERTVGPTLGKDSVIKGLRSMLIGFIAVIAFMIIYYLLSGLIADVALLMNLLIIVAVMSFFDATLTLPGIAGLVLTIGMSVDANVLIFERIREELALKRPIKTAIKNGYSKAFITIFDSNLTTLVSALILFQFGTGPVRGFATTLTIGLFSSMFTAIVVTRTVLDILTNYFNLQKLRMLQWLKDSKIDFLSKRKIAYALSLIVIISGMVSFVIKGDKNYGIDFTGGTIQQFRFKEPVSSEAVREPLRQIGYGDVSIQRLGDGRDIIIKTDKDVSAAILSKFKEVFKEGNYELERIETVGPVVGKDLSEKSLLALFFAIIGICIYVGFRFEFRFAFAGILALVHDALVCIGALSLTGRQLSVNAIAAILTIIGYSINDTIVIFDRIREDRKIMRKADYKTIINTSINQTLSRTILTSLTTLMVVTALFFLGGEVINDFAFVLLVGIIAGCYSTVYIACPLLIDWPTRKRR